MITKLGAYIRNTARILSEDFRKDKIKLKINKISSSHFTVSLANGTIPSTKDFIISFEPILSPDPYVQIYGEEVGEDLYLYGLINPQIQLSDLHNKHYYMKLKLYNKNLLIFI